MTVMIKRKWWQKPFIKAAFMKVETGKKFYVFRFRFLDQF